MKIFFLIFSLLVAKVSYGQDYHFSQFFNTPLVINPAQTGFFFGNQRVNIFYRKASIITPYETYGASFDSKFFDDEMADGYLASGLSVVRDKAGASEFGLTEILASVTYHYMTGVGYFSAGIQSGFAQRKINYDNLYWGSQYNELLGDFDPDLPKGGSGSYDNYGYFDLSAGVLYTFYTEETNITSNDGIFFSVGSAWYHFHSPKIGFSEALDAKMHSKYVVHGSGMLGLFQTNTSITPSFLFARQGPYQKIIAGSGFRFLLQPRSVYTRFRKNYAMTLGCHYRFKDAIIPYIDFELINFTIGISYDANVGSIQSSSYQVGGFEVSLRYINVSRTRRIMPKPSFL